jgi:phospholipid/cholesterol/gamma-HCH transport system permease protein
VTPRIVALVLTLPLLTVAADVFGLVGGGIVGKQLYGLDPNSYIASARNGIDIDDVLGGVIKPIVFGFIIGVVSCFRGLNTTGGTVGVGKSTTNAVVTASICVIIADFFLSKILQTLFKAGIF